MSPANHWARILFHPLKKVDLIHHQQAWCCISHPADEKVLSVLFPALAGIEENATCTLASSTNHPGALKSLVIILEVLSTASSLQT